MQGIILKTMWQNKSLGLFRSAVPLHSMERERARPKDLQSGGAEAVAFLSLMRIYMQHLFFLPVFGLTPVAFDNGQTAVFHLSYKSYDQKFL